MSGQFKVNLFRICRFFYTVKETKNREKKTYARREKKTCKLYTKLSSIITGKEMIILQK